MSSHIELREELKELKKKLNQKSEKDCAIYNNLPIHVRIKEIESEFKKTDRLVSKWNYPYTNYLKALKNIRL